MFAGVLVGGAAAGAAVWPLAPAHADPGRASGSAGGTGVPVNVRDHGAKGDGRHDDTAAIQAAVDAAAPAGRVLYFPSGQYVVRKAIRLGAENIWRGDGMWNTTIVRRFDGSAIAIPSGRLPSFVADDLAFDGDGRAAVILGLDALDRVELTSCRFTNFDDGGNGARKVTATMVGAIEVAAVTEARFVACLWHNPAVLAGFGIAVWAKRDGGGQSLSFHGRNTFLWLNDSIRLETGTKPLAGAVDRDGTYQGVDVDGAYFDGFWWLLPSAYDGSGSSVTYDGTTLTDTKADFSGVVAGAYPATTNIRAMPVRRTGSISTSAATVLIDSDADFGTVGVIRGEIVRSDQKFAIVTGTTRNVSQLGIEGWLDENTLLPTEPPAAGKGYTLYGIYISDVTAKTGTQLTVLPWTDLHGKAVTPDDGTRYEVLQTRPRYHILATQGVEHLRVTNCTLRRGWADQIGANSARSAIIVGNVIEDGQDEGCTLGSEGTAGTLGRFQFIGNTIRHQGTASLWINGTSSVVEGNVSISPHWRHNDTEGLICHVHMRATQYSRVADNTFDTGGESATAAFGISLMGTISPAYPNDATGNVLSDNVLVGESRGDVAVYGTATAGNELAGISSVTLFAGGKAQRVDARGNGSPEGALVATPGSRYLNEAGGAGSTLWVKETGTTAAGWVAK